MTDDASDAELLHLYSRHASQAAFAALVARHLGLVHAAALRQVRSPDLARDVAQAVFVQLARDAGKLRPDCVLPAWLHTATRRRAIDLIRAEARRKRREESAWTTALEPAAHSMHELDADVSARIDEALAHLADADREALILRFFAGQNLRAIGARLGLSEDAAQKRVERALERLRARLRVGGALSLGAWLSANAAPLAPTGLAAAITSTALSTKAALATGAFASALLMTTAQKTFFAAGLALAVGVGVFQYQNTGKLRRELDDLSSRHSAETRAWTARLAALEAENQGLRAEAGTSKAALHAIKTEAADPAIAAMSAWIERLQTLKEHLVAHPEATTPAMSALDENDWLAAAMAELKSERDFRRAAAGLRNAADQKFVRRAQAALRKFAKQNGGAFPTDLSQLVPYFDNPIDPQILERWIILPQADPRVANVQIGDRDGKVITQRTSIDEEFDQRLVFSDSGNGGTSFGADRVTETFSKVIAAFKEANPGRTPKTAAELLPFATTAEERGIVEKHSRR